MTRVFETGATRDKDETKLDFEGFLSPLVLTRYAEYMHECRLRNIPAGQMMRESDNWQKGIPLDAYMKSGFRHFMDWWRHHRSSQTPTKHDIDTLCALFFNVQGYLHELLKAGYGNDTRTSQVSDQQPVSSSTFASARVPASKLLVP